MCGYACSHCGRCKGLHNIEGSYCFACGTVNEAGTARCTRCGAKLPAPPGTSFDRAGTADGAPQVRRR